METRPAESEDRRRVETLARDSLRSSYALSQRQTETIVESESHPEMLAVGLDDPNATDRPFDREQSVPGRDAPLFVLHTSEGRSDPYGYFYSNCGSTDGLDRLGCGECGNLHLADEWDDSYL